MWWHWCCGIWQGILILYLAFLLCLLFYQQDDDTRWWRRTWVFWLLAQLVWDDQTFESHNLFEWVITTFFIQHLKSSDLLCKMFEIIAVGVKNQNIYIYYIKFSVVKESIWHNSLEGLLFQTLELFDKFLSILSFSFKSFCIYGFDELLLFSILFII